MLNTAIANGASKPAESNQKILPPDLQKLVDDYNARFDRLTSKERARLEKQLWDVTPSHIRNNYVLVNDKGTRTTQHARGRFLQEVLGRAATVDYCLRFTLLSGCPISDPLWERVEKGLPVRTAVRLLSDTRRRAEKEGRSPLNVITDVLQEYDQLSVVTLPGGQVIRKRTPYSIQVNPAAAVGKRRPVPASASEPDPEARNFWPVIRGQIASHIQGRMKDVDPIIAERLLREIERDLKTVVDEATWKLDRTRRQALEDVKLQKGVSRGRIRAACTTLSMDPPKSDGVDAATLKLAKQQKKRLVRLYHPDSHQGSEATRPQYEAVLAAYALLEDAHQYTKDNQNG